MSATRSRFGRQDGVVIVWFALFLLTVLGFVGLGIDMAKLMTARTQLQNAADAAALAGASAIDPATGALMPAEAVVRAQQVCAQNKAFIEDSQPVILQAGDVVFPTANQIRVTVRREGGNSIVTHFAGLLGIHSLDMAASATARIDTAGAVECGIVPLGVSPEAGQVFEPGCSPGYSLKLPGGSGAQGDYYPVRFPMCSSGACGGVISPGAATYRCLLKNGYCCSVEIGDLLDTQSGNISGPTTDAIKDRFKADIDKRENICYSDYFGNGQRVVIVPVVEPTGAVNQVRITRFAVFFLKNIPDAGNQNSLMGEFLYGIVPGSGGGNGGNGGAVTFSLALVQ